MLELTGALLPEIKKIPIIIVYSLLSIIVVLIGAILLEG